MQEEQRQAGASTGEFEALELRDGDKSRYLGKGVQKAVENINTIINEAIRGLDASDIYAIDKAMIEADGTKDKSKLGANAILAVSIACCKSGCDSIGYSTVSVLRRCQRKQTSGADDEYCKRRLPCFMHTGLDVQEFMVMPVGAASFKEGLRWCSEVFHALAAIFKGKRTGNLCR